MPILAILDGRASAARDDDDFLWPAGVAAVTYVITTVEPDRFVLDAIDVTDDGRGLFSIDLDRSRLAEALLAIAQAIERQGTGVIRGNPPPPRPGDPPFDLELRPGPGPRDPVLALAVIRAQVVRSFEQLELRTAIAPRRKES